MYELKSNQKNAIRFIANIAVSRETENLAQLNKIMRMETRRKSIDADMLLNNLLKYAKITVNFHPDRITREGDMVIDRLLETGIYTNQFITWMSNGGVTAFPGGERDIWEHNIFGGAYHTQDTRSEDRPKYGALNLLNFIDGAAPRFGSCCLGLYPSIVDRCTFSFGDSSTAPNAFGSSNHFTSVLLAILDALIQSGKLLDALPIGIDEAIDAMLQGFPLRKPENGREKCRTIETHIHGDVSLLRDVEAIYVDGSFAQSDIQEKLTRMCGKYDIQLHWIPRRHVSIDDIDDSFRGPLMKTLAKRAMEEFAFGDNEITAWRIGKFAQFVVREPAKWADFGDSRQMLQYVKQLWHIVANYGCS
jgi:hypothetical protein